MKFLFAMLSIAAFGSGCVLKEPVQDLKGSSGKKKFYKPPVVEPFAVDNKKPLVVYSSGYNSCLNGEEVLQSTFAVRFNSVIERYKEIHGEDLQFVATCYSGFQSKKILYINNSDRTVRSTHWQEHKPIIGLIKSYKTQNIYFYGHSYGGWLAMKLSQNFEGTRLVTIDPISAAKCWVFTVATRGLLSSNCRSFPQDISNHERYTIAKRTKWKHYYQNDFPYLHSGPVFFGKDAANRIITFHGRTEKDIEDYSSLENINDHVSGGEHGAISLHQQVWMPIYSYLNIGIPPITIDRDALPY